MEDKTVIQVDKTHRLVVYKEFRGTGWKWYVEKQRKWFFNLLWGASSWNSSSLFVPIGYCLTKESAIREAQTIKRNYLSND